MTVSEYNDRLAEYMTRHFVLSKLHHLYSTRDGNFMPDKWAQLKSLYRVWAEGMIYAEKKCRKLAMGNVDFSPEVDLAKKRRWLWKEVVKKREGQPVSTAMIKRKARQCRIQCPLTVSLAQAKARFYAVDTDSEYDSLKRNAPTYRYELRHICQCMSDRYSSTYTLYNLLRQDSFDIICLHLHSVLCVVHFHSSIPLDEDKIFPH
jgi:hypothetical protein